MPCLLLTEQVVLENSSGILTKISHNTPKSLYKTLHYKTGKTPDPESVDCKQKMYILYRKVTINGHFSI